MAFKWRRRRESLFHKLWVTLVVTCGVLTLMLLTLADHKGKRTVTSGAEKQLASTQVEGAGLERMQDDSEARGTKEKHSVATYATSSTPEALQSSTVEEISTEPPKSESTEDAKPMKASTTTGNDDVDLSLNSSGLNSRKGAPPRTDYFIGLLELISKAGATGVLIEWEDMFPYSGLLEVVKSTNAYTIEDVDRILKTAKDLGLEVIPLVQTFGHMEWILKYEQFRKYRENDRFPQVICLGNESAVDLVKEALRQVIEIHLPYGINYFHIGFDEAFQYGVCDDSLKLARTLQGDANDVAAEHLRRIATYAHRLTKEAKILAWHDILVKLLGKFSKLEMLELKTVIQPVFWDYSEGLVTMSRGSFDDVASVFPKAWVSPAFKGANTPGSNFVDYNHYHANNLQWLGELRDLRTNGLPSFIEGIIITGWSRLINIKWAKYSTYGGTYNVEIHEAALLVHTTVVPIWYDHLARLCEIWPAGTPSMVLNVQVALIGAQRRFDDYDRNRDHFELNGVQKLAPTKMTNFSSSDGEQKSESEGFEGGSAHDILQNEWPTYVEQFEQFEKRDHVLGWLSPYNMKYNISQMWYLNGVMREFMSSAGGVVQAARYMEAELMLLFHKETVDEFIFSNVEPILQKIQYYRTSIQKLMEMRTQSRRFFEIDRLNISALYNQIVDG